MVCSKSRIEKLKIFPTGYWISVQKGFDVYGRKCSGRFHFSAVFHPRQRWFHFSQFYIIAFAESATLKTTGREVARYVVLIIPFLFVCGLKTNRMWLKHPGRENQKADGNMFCLLISNCIIFMFEVKSSRSGSAEKRSFTFGRCPVLKNENQLCLLQLTSRTLQPQSAMLIALELAYLTSELCGFILAYLFLLLNVKSGNVMKEQ